MENKIYIKSILGEVLFEFKKKNNTIKDTVVEANLREANLRGADLRGADLRVADLRGANLPMFCRWRISIENDKIKIGCKSKTIPEWDEWFKSSEEFETSRNSEEFKRIHACYLANKAYYEFLK